ncbi:hypothetical protein RhiJN_19240 [Ceratobasidium sp. AG-Ba]|nr:hypothetical protein RhiJN_19240 [Ceratobasidium sp. AG-Ba]
MPQPQRPALEVASPQAGPNSAASITPITPYSHGRLSHGHSRKNTVMSMSPSMNLLNGDIGDGLSGRATRQRTQLIVDGFTNLALVAVLFSGVQAQLISITNDDKDSRLAEATNAAFFGGLMLSVFTALLATLSGRWFSILREDDSEFLASCWLAAELKQPPPNLEDYVRFQLRIWEQKLSSHAEPTPFGDDDTASEESAEKGGLPNPRDEDIQRVIELIRKEKESKTTIREHIMSKVLLCAVGLCSAAFGLFCAGIVLLVWNKQPRWVATFTSGVILACLLLLPGFFLQHRHKHVISKLNLSRPSL